jgi:hypothetical protein
MNTFKQIALLAITVGSGWLLAGCEPNLAKAPVQPDLVSIAISPGAATVQIGATQALTVNGTFSDSSTSNLTSASIFLSSNTSVALVSATGVVTAKGTGTATITATHTPTSKTATATITVPAPALVSIAITPKPVNLVAGTTQQLTVTGTYSDASTAVLTTGLTFIPNNAYATVTNSGLVTAVAAGTTTVTVTDTASGYTDTVDVIVTAASGGGGGWPTITFDDAAITYGRTDFGGVTSTQVADPAAGGAQLQVGKVVKPNTAQVWGGTTVSTIAGDQVPTIPFSATATKMTVKVYSPAAGIHVRLKVEDAADGTHSVETEALTTMANAWETLTFDFASQATGTAALNLTYTYNRASIFFDFGNVPGADETFYFDDIAFVTPGGGGGGWPTITFDDAAITYGRTDFGGVTSTQVADPAAGGAQLQVGQVVKPPTAQVWGGTTVSTIAGDKVPTIPFSATATKMTVKVYSPAAGIHVRLKVEDAADGTHSVETEALTTMANAWETLTFDFASQATGTAALNLAFTFNRASIFFDFGNVPGADETFYFDDIAFVAAGGGGGGGGGGTVVSNVFGNGALDAGVAFVPFGGSDNTPLPAPDAGTLFTDGSAALKVVVTATGGAYSGGAWVASAPRDLRAANALVFWAKASTAVTPPAKLLKVQLGNDGGAGANVDFQVESIGLTVTTNWQQYIIPLPDPTKANGIDGLFSFAEGNDNYTLWLAKVQYVNVPGAVLGSGVVSGDGFNGVPQPLSVPVGSTYTISPAPNSITWTLGANPTFAGSPIQPLANGGNLNNDGWRWFTLSSSNNAVATVSPDGVISGVSAGTATFTGTLPSGTAIPGQTSVTVTAPLATPANYAPAPPTPQGAAISLFNSSNTYTNVPVDTWSTSWSGCCNTLVDPFAIAGGNGVKQYTLSNFVGVEFGLNGTNSPVDASGLTIFHVDVWSPNPSTNLEIQLVNDAGGTAAIGKFEAGQIATGGWVSLDIPLASFAGLTIQNKINQLLFVAAGPTVLYVDNVYFH